METMRTHNTGVTTFSLRLKLYMHAAFITYLFLIRNMAMLQIHPDIFVFVSKTTKGKPECTSKNGLKKDMIHHRGNTN